VPISKKAEALTAKQAFRSSSRFGGSLLEGKIMKGELYYYDPDIPKGEKGRLRKGTPDFLWLSSVRLPKRSLFDRRTIRGVASRALKKAMLEFQGSRATAKIVIDTP